MNIVQLPSSEAPVKQGLFLQTRQSRQTNTSYNLRPRGAYARTKAHRKQPEHFCHHEQLPDFVRVREVSDRPIRSLLGLGDRRDACPHNPPRSARKHTLDFARPAISDRAVHKQVDLRAIRNICDRNDEQRVKLETVPQHTVQSRVANNTQRSWGQSKRTGEALAHRRVDGDVIRGEEDSDGQRRRRAGSQVERLGRTRPRRERRPRAPGAAGSGRWRRAEARRETHRAGSCGCEHRWNGAQDGRQADRRRRFAEHWDALMRHVLKVRRQSISTERVYLLFSGV
jgi:hypothetical protein